MASLRFFFDGDRRQERVGPPMPFFPGRYMVPRRYQNAEIPRERQYKHEDENNKSHINNEMSRDIKQEDPEIIEISNPDISHTEQEKVTHEEKKKTGSKNKEAKGKDIPHDHSNSEEEDQTKKEDIYVNVSEKFIGQLSAVENNLVNVKGQVDNAKNLFDEVIYKLDSFVQIMDIIKLNEERRLNKPQASVLGVKTNKDTVDEFLELLQAPAFQTILRQFLVGILVKK